MSTSRGRSGRPAWLRVFGITDTPPLPNWKAKLSASPVEDRNAPGSLLAADAPTLVGPLGPLPATTTAVWLLPPAAAASAPAPDISPVPDDRAEGPAARSEDDNTADQSSDPLADPLLPENCSAAGRLLTSDHAIGEKIELPKVLPLVAVDEPGVREPVPATLNQNGDVGDVVAGEAEKGMPHR